MEEKRIKITDEHLIDLGKRMSGIRMLLADLAYQRAHTDQMFWDRVRKMYPKLQKCGVAFDCYTNEIIVKEDC